MSYKVNHQERAALRGLPHVQILLYLMGIRPYMDYATGIVGIKRGISYQSLREEIYVDPHQGYKTESFSKDQIKRALKGLEKAGVIKLRSCYKKLILQCPLATTDKCDQNKAALKPPLQTATTSPRKNIENSIDNEESQKKSATTKSAKAATPPVSGNNITLSLADSGISLIAENFQPSTAVTEKAKKHHCPTAECCDELMKFIVYHQSRATKRCDWNAEFLGWLLRSKQYHKEKKNVKQNNSTSNRYPTSKNQSAVDRVFSANQKLLKREGRVIDHHR